jgi:hypothetical protein
MYRGAPGGLSVGSTARIGSIDRRVFDANSVEIRLSHARRRSGDGDWSFKAASLGSPELHSHGGSGAKRLAPDDRKAMERLTATGLDSARAGVQQHAHPARDEQQPGAGVLLAFVEHAAALPVANPAMAIAARAIAPSRT